MESCAMTLDIQSIARALGGKKTGQFTANVPGPGHRPGDRSLSITIKRGRLFVDRHHENIRFCHSGGHSIGHWYCWNGARWQIDQTNSTYQLAREFGRKIGEDQDERGRKAIGKNGFVSGIERFARVDRRVAVTVDYWDQDPWVLGTPGGTVDLMSGKLHEPRREAGITKLTAVAPLETGCPRWLQFLNETTGGDTELVRFLQQWCGYALTGVTREHALVFVYGPGGNGKSVFLNIVTAILGDYATTAAMDTFTASHGDKHPTDLAMLRGARLVTASETEEGRPWAESRIKQLTGGDKIAARFMRQDFFEFVPQFKLTIVGNHKPVLHNVDEAARRRFNIVPFMLKPNAIKILKEIAVESKAYKFVIPEAPSADPRIRLTYWHEIYERMRKGGQVERSVDMLREIRKEANACK